MTSSPMLTLAQHTFSNGDVLTVYSLQGKARICLRKSREVQERIVIPLDDLAKFSDVIQSAKASAP